MKVLQIARSPKHWKADNPVLNPQVFRKGFIHHGIKVVEGHERMGTDYLESLAKSCDFIFLTKLKDPDPRYLRLKKPTVCVYGDWREPSHPNRKFHDKFDLVFLQQDDIGDGSRFLPPPVWVDDWAAGKTSARLDKWLWTGGFYPGRIFDGHRKKDVQLLPDESSVWGIQGNRVRGRDYMAEIFTHQYGLSVSNTHKILKYTSSRLAHYLSGGLTPAVRWFPGVEDLVPPETFIYKNRESLREFIKNPKPQDPSLLHEFAREVYDGRVLVAKILKEVECLLLS